MCINTGGFLFHEATSKSSIYILIGISTINHPAIGVAPWKPSGGRSGQLLGGRRTGEAEPGADPESHRGNRQGTRTTGQYVLLIWCSIQYGAVYITHDVNIYILYT